MVLNFDLIQESDRRCPLDRRKLLAERLRESQSRRPLTPEEREARLSILYAETGSPERARIALERIIGGNDLDNINYLERGMIASRSVCRIELRGSSGDILGHATGSLIGPGVLLTNEHVFGAATEAVHSVADFDYELDVNGHERPAVHFAFEPDRLFHANRELDYAVVAVASRSIDGRRELDEWGWLPLSSVAGKGDVGEYLTIIQHPNGELKQICVRENKLLQYTGDTVWYQTDTRQGSSGSAAFNRYWQVIALHHSGVPNKDEDGNYLTKDGKVWDPSMGDSAIDWIANEGIRISSIVRDLREKLGANPLIRAVLEATSALPEQSRAHPGKPFHLDSWVELEGDRGSLVVPLRVPMEVVQRGTWPGVRAPAAPSAVAAAPAAPPSDGEDIERVVIDQTTLHLRPGYDPNFLGKRRLSVPIPKVGSKLKNAVATLLNRPKEYELKYYNYSVVMNKERKLAFFSAVNIDGNRRRDVGKREGDKWFLDPRIDRRIQIDDTFYGRQARLEAREKNPFDRGHLVRRLDATWGTTLEQAKMYGNDTFHFTNCAPQFWKFNQGKALWAGIEDYVLNKLEMEKRRACVINGPVFDGPPAPPDGLPDPDAARKPDPRFKGVAIPKFFWKLMVIEENRRLSASAFLLSQQDSVLDIDRIEEAGMLERLSAAEAKVFQISVRDLTAFTGLEFGKLARRDTKETVRGERPRLLQGLSDIHI